MRNAIREHGDSSTKLAIAKDTRVELRTSSDVKETLRSAASLSGVDMTAFILQAAFEKAQSIINRQHTRELNEKAWNHLNNLIMSPPAPNDRLVQLMTGKPRYERK